MNELTLEDERAKIELKLSRMARCFTHDLPRTLEMMKKHKAYMTQDVATINGERVAFSIKFEPYPEPSSGEV